MCAREALCPRGRSMGGHARFLGAQPRAMRALVGNHRPFVSSTWSRSRRWRLRGAGTMFAQLFGPTVVIGDEFPRGLDARSHRLACSARKGGAPPGGQGGAPSAAAACRVRAAAGERSFPKPIFAGCPIVDAASCATRLELRGPADVARRERQRRRARATGRLLLRASLIRSRSGRRTEVVLETAQAS